MLDTLQTFPSYTLSLPKGLLAIKDPVLDNGPIYFLEYDQTLKNRKLIHSSYKLLKHRKMNCRQRNRWQNFKKFLEKSNYQGCPKDMFAKIPHCIIYGTCSQTTLLWSRSQSLNNMSNMQLNRPKHIVPCTLKYRQQHIYELITKNTTKLFEKLKNPSCPLMNLDASHSWMLVISTTTNKKA